MWGWLGLALSETGGMKGADFATVEFTGGRPAITDGWSSEFARPVADASQDWVRGGSWLGG